MFVLRSNYTALLAQYERVLEQRDAARRDARDHLSAIRTAAGQYGGAEEALTRVRLARLQDAITYTKRIARLSRACARYRTENGRLLQQVARLQTAYDNATDLDNPALEHGATWQTRRADKPRTTVTS
ncbi:hypothetical protein ACFWNT_11060 [Streptomyces sp. NPDC058409]|uniref:hypothetical protein n=1 Tax=Streptomyces sp. NPDC058409 TaxID=3346484 RepID=UPI0036579735